MTDIQDIPDTVKELRAEVKARGIRGYSTKNKSALIEALKNNYLKTNPAPAPAPAPVPEKTAELVSETAPVETAPVKEKKKRGPNKWNQFLSEHSKKHGVLIKDAMKNREAYDAWLKEKNL